ncbi:MAG TPA: PLP-dependent cysteine synthase family protein [Jatrophihabitans sp.]|jgi:cysteine synthase A
MSHHQQTVDLNRASAADREWVDDAINRVEADANRSADTHLMPFPVASAPGVHVYLKDESTHPTGSLKHRLARSLFLYTLCNGQIREGTTVVEASSGSTAISEAYFARMLGLPFIAVIPATTSQEKVALIEREGGKCHLVEDPGSVYSVAAEIAEDTGGHYIDQFTYAERATDWRGNNNIAESIFDQMSMEEHSTPEWIVVGAGTGGTSATIGRYIRYQHHETMLAVVDVENSAFFPSWRDEDASVVTGGGSRIEGIGRPRAEPSFIPGVVDRMLVVPDAASVATARAMEPILGRRVGPSTGTNMWGVLHLAAEMSAKGDEGSIVTLLCDGGERYAHTYYNDSWLEEQGIDLSPYSVMLSALL